ncbi:unnamed protein product [Arctia plantaginis]|uniref:Carboxylesterase type B domain-containing protein n=1 Tax=Arctia plantaginis TaxID=874455 RepID=A0A8S1BGC1_ARCPL|nr:unnamed protein product [Arctia plantaginis]
MCGILWIDIVLIACVFGQTGPVVDTSVGQIVGLKDEFIKFLGIPYAVVDVNDPFGLAKPHPPFNTPYFANKDPMVCPQVYNKVILQSVEMVSLLLIDEPKNNDYLANITSKLGIDSKDLKTVDMIKELSKINTELIISMTKNDNFRPCVHNLIIGDKMKRNNFKDMKIIIGNAEKEALFFYTGVVNYTNMIEMELNKHFTNIPEKGVTKAENFYLTGNLKYNTIDFGCDLYFNYPAIRSIRHYLRNNATVYRYLFTYDGGRNYIKVRDGIDAEGATHGDELGYLFDADLFGDTITAADQSVIDTITTFWTNFAKYGNPTPEDLSSLTWPKIDDNLEFYMNIAAHPVLERRYREKEMVFWDSFYKDFGVYSTGHRFAEEAEFMKNRASQLGIMISLNVAVVLIRFVM